MYLFRDKDTIEISLSCKLCLKEFKIIISAEEYSKIVDFPFKKEIIHGEPPHKLIAFISRQLEVEKFEIEKEAEEVPAFSQELTKRVLSDIGLTEEEIELYFMASGRDVVSIGELALLMKTKTEEDCKRIADKFVDKGLFKEIVAATPHYTALPPYSALISQLKKFHEYIMKIKADVPPQLKWQFKKLEKQAGSVQTIRDNTDSIIGLKEKVLSKLDSQKTEFNKTISEIEKIKEISSGIADLEQGVKEVIEGQTQELADEFETSSTNIAEILRRLVLNLTEQLETVNKKITEISNLQTEEFSSKFDEITKKIFSIMTGQVKEITTQVRVIKDQISASIEKLKLGALQKSVDTVVGNVLNSWLIVVPEQLIKPIKAIERSSDEALEEIKESLNKNLSDIIQANVDGIVGTSIDINKRLKSVQDLSKESIESITRKLNNQLIPNLKASLDSTIANINEITETSANSGENIKQIFAEISKDFNEAISMTGEKVSGISTGVNNSFNELREIFATQVLDTLNNVLNDISEKLELSTTTITEFYEQARKTSAYTMKDIWFIRSIEAVKAHINHELTKAKAKILIVAPSLTDIDFESIQNLRKHINVRITTHIDGSQPKHREILQVLDTLENVAYRNRELQNLWGINKDYEEVILCVLSESTAGTEIAGIGSIIDEHIKIFVPVLEDAWVGAKKFI